MKDGFAYTPAGRVHYLEAGNGEPLLLMHTNGSSAYQYEDCFGQLAQRFRVVAWDMPGHGDSDPLRGHTPIETYSDTAVALLDALGIAKAHVAGGSVGGVIAIDLAARHASRLLQWRSARPKPRVPVADYLRRASRSRPACAASDCG